jgi:predicted transcriptional regulator
MRSGNPGSALMAPKKTTSFRISEEAARLLSELASDMGITRSASIELAIRDLHRQRFEGRKPAEKPRKNKRSP